MLHLSTLARLAGDHTQTQVKTHSFVGSCVRASQQPYVHNTHEGAVGETYIL